MFTYSFIIYLFIYLFIYYRKKKIQMDQDCVFFETAMGLDRMPHTYIGTQFTCFSGTKV
jgi:hypothetical protein